MESKDAVPEIPTTHKRDCRCLNTVSDASCTCGLDYRKRIARLKAQVDQKHCYTKCASKRRCSICDNQTTLACSDCTIDLRDAIYVCHQSACRDQHEKKCAHELEAENATLRISTGHYHDTHCNSSRNVPMGEGGCSCFMYQRATKVEAENTRLKAQVERLSDSELLKQMDIPPYLSMFVLRQLEDRRQALIAARLAEPAAQPKKD